jgi:hypothetical protein
MAKILLTNPGHDRATKLLSHWIDAVADHIAGLGNEMEVIHLKGETVNKTTLRSSIDDHNPRLLLLNGHGSQGCVYGHNNIPLLEASDAQDGHLKNRVIHALACKAAAQLGGELIALGAAAFIGYKEDFQVVSQTSVQPENDIVAKLYLEPAYEVTSSLAEGKTAQESYTKAQKMYASNIRKALNENADPSVIAPLLSNLKHHVLIGDASATL